MSAITSFNEAATRIEKISPTNAVEDPRDKIMKEVGPTLTSSNRPFDLMNVAEQSMRNMMDFDPDPNNSFALTDSRMPGNPVVCSDSRPNFGAAASDFGHDSNQHGSGHGGNIDGEGLLTAMQVNTETLDKKKEWDALRDLFKQNMVG